MKIYNRVLSCVLVVAMTTLSFAGVPSFGPPLPQPQLPSSVAAELADVDIEHALLQSIEHQWISTHEQQAGSALYTYLLECEEAMDTFADAVVALAAEDMPSGVTIEGDGPSLLQLATEQYAECQPSLESYAQSDQLVADLIAARWDELSAPSMRALIVEQGLVAPVLEVAMHDFHRALRVSLGGPMIPENPWIREEAACGQELISDTIVLEYLLALNSRPPHRDYEAAAQRLNDFQQQLLCLSGTQIQALSRSLHAAYLYIDEVLYDRGFAHLRVHWRSALVNLFVLLEDAESILGPGASYTWLRQHLSNALFMPEYSQLHDNFLGMYNIETGQLEFHRVCYSLDPAPLVEMHTSLFSTPHLGALTQSDPAAAEYAVLQTPSDRLTPYGASLEQTAQQICGTGPQWSQGNNDACSFSVAALEAVLHPLNKWNGSCSTLKSLEERSGCRLLCKTPVGLGAQAASEQVVDLQGPMGLVGGASDAACTVSSMLGAKHSVGQCLDDANVPQGNPTIIGGYLLGCNDMQIDRSFLEGVAPAGKAAKDKGGDDTKGDQDKQDKDGDKADEEKKDGDKDDERNKPKQSRDDADETTTNDDASGTQENQRPADEDKSKRPSGHGDAFPDVPELPEGSWGRGTGGDGSAHGGAQRGQGGMAGGGMGGHMASPPSGAGVANPFPWPPGLNDAKAGLKLPADSEQYLHFWLRAAGAAHGDLLNRVKQVGHTKNLSADDQAFRRYQHVMQRLANSTILRKAAVRGVAKGKAIMQQSHFQNVLADALSQASGKSVSSAAVAAAIDTSKFSTAFRGSSPYPEKALGKGFFKHNVSHILVGRIFYLAAQRAIQGDGAGAASVNLDDTIDIFIDDVAGILVHEEVHGIDLAMGLNAGHAVHRKFDQLHKAAGGHARIRGGDHSALTDEMSVQVPASSHSGGSPSQQSSSGDAHPHDLSGENRAPLCSPVTRQGRALLGCLSGITYPDLDTSQTPGYGLLPPTDAIGLCLESAASGAACPPIDCGPSMQMNSDCACEPLDGVTPNPAQLQLFQNSLCPEVQCGPNQTMGPNCTCL